MHTTQLSPEAALRLFRSVYKGEVPKNDIEHILVGREEEIKALLDCLDDVRSGGHTMKIIVGPYGSGKTTFLNVAKSYAAEDNFVCAYATLLRCPLTSRRVYSMLMNSLSVPLQGIIRTLEERVGAKELPERLGSIRLECSRYFTMAILRYLDGVRGGNQSLAQEALDWLRGEYLTKTESRTELNIRCTITDENWYAMLKVFNQVLLLAGYSGLCLLLDEVSSLSVLPNSIIRSKNITALQSIYSDRAEHGADHMLFLVAGTRDFIEDRRRGLASNSALYSRISYNSEGKDDYSQSVMPLHVLDKQELYTLLYQLKRIDAIAHGQEELLDNSDQTIDKEIVDYLSALNAQPGGLEKVTPREASRKFCQALTLRRLNEGMDNGDLFKEVARVDDGTIVVPAESESAEIPENISDEHIGEEESHTDIVIS